MKPLSVKQAMAALAGSATINIVDKKHINRKVPVVIDESSDSSDYECHDREKPVKRDKKLKVKLAPEVSRPVPSAGQTKGMASDRCGCIYSDLC
jgi:hypothetical protein